MCNLCVHGHVIVNCESGNWQWRALGGGWEGRGGGCGRGLLMVWENILLPSTKCSHSVLNGSYSCIL